MKTTAKVALGTASASFLIYAIVMVAISLYPEPVGSVRVAVFWVMTILTLTVTGGQFIFYNRHILVNDRLSDKDRSRWLLAMHLGFLGLFAVYWYRHIWHAPKKTTGMGEGGGDQAARGQKT